MNLRKINLEKVKRNRMTQKKVYDRLKINAKRGKALRSDELAEQIGLPAPDVKAALKRLKALRLAHVAGKDALGECWFPGMKDMPLLNPAPRRPS